MSDFLHRIKDLSRDRLALLASELQQKLAQVEGAQHEPIAIIGAAGRYPTAGGRLDRFWDLLLAGRSGIQTATAAGRPVEALHGAAFGSRVATEASAHGAFLDEYDRFDAEFFGVAPREAEIMDPQQRALLEVSWQAFEDAGHLPSRGRGGPVGVFVGICTHDFAHLLVSSAADCGGYFARGTAHSIAAGRLSYALGLQGPSLAVDTACSSSLVAAHLACRSLRTRECDLAVVAGVNIILSPLVTVDLARAGLLSPTGQCRPFDARADGYVRGEGCGALILKRLSEARRDRDRIIAVIRGSAVNHDGGGAGLVAPSGAAQQAVIRAALADARVDPGDVDYVEASSVGTLLGDPIELDALSHTVAAAAP